MGFMNEKELAYATGYTQAAAQIRYLKREGIAYRLNRLGFPLVTWAAWEGVSAEENEYQPPKPLCGAEYTARSREYRDH